MLTQWLEGLGEENLPIRLRVIALGACFTETPKSQGYWTRWSSRAGRIFYSRCLDGHPADVMVDSNHFDYEYREDVKGLVHDWI